MKTIFESLKNHFLISMPQLSDPQFQQTVIYLCEHTPEGALGITINRPSEVLFSELAAHLELEVIAPKMLDVPLYSGGPVESERGFILHSREVACPNELPVTSEVSLSASFSVIEDLANGKGPESFLIALGCSGWDAGQLESEISQNQWLVCEADLDVLFNTPSDLQFSAATRVLGFDMCRLSPDVGHG
ncbi:YqgE/AlgH family protein [Marinomonas algicola]|uniref:YqgE/AlgH family protein n=1 Tax=Marinomonas algicola TaxID=2773454 RepID=UPI0017492F8F|nr:YqgE/AlgH family protein [Marinomonas algicola]